MIEITVILPIYLYDIKLSTGLTELVLKIREGVTAALLYHAIYIYVRRAIIPLVSWCTCDVVIACMTVQELSFCIGERYMEWWFEYLSEGFFVSYVRENLCINQCVCKKTIRKWLYDRAVRISVYGNNLPWVVYDMIITNIKISTDFRDLLKTELVISFK